MVTERTYWVLLIVGLVLFIVVDIVWIMPTHWDIGVNLFTDAIFTMFTIVFLTWIFTIREKRELEPVREVALRRLKPLVDHLFLLLQNLCELKPKGKKVRSLLLELSSQGTIQLRHDIEIYFSKNRSDLEGYIKFLENSAE